MKSRRSDELAGSDDRGGASLLTAGEASTRVVARHIDPGRTLGPNSREARAMTMDVPPGGTYGKRVPKGSLASVGGRMLGSIIRLSGGRIGGEMMLLTTVG